MTSELFTFMQLGFRHITNLEAMGETGFVKVIFTRYDNVGGLIEGSFAGTLVTDTRKNATISISGNFSMIRDKDRKGHGAVTN